MPWGLVSTPEVIVGVLEAPEACLGERASGLGQAGAIGEGFHCEF